MALPAAFLAVGTAAIPYLLMWSPDWVIRSYSRYVGDITSHIRPLPGNTELVIILILFLPVAAISGAWISFAAFKKGGGALKSAMIGITYFSLCILSLCAWTAVREESWNAVKPYRQDFRIGNGVIGKGGHHAFLNTANRGIVHAVIFNLETHEWHETKRCSQGFMILDQDHTGEAFPVWLSGVYPNSMCPQYVVQPAGDGALDFWNGETGQAIACPDVTTLLGCKADSILLKNIRFPQNVDRYRFDDVWVGFCNDREELRSTGKSGYIHDGIWIVQAHDETDGSEQEPSWRWMLYHEKDRTFTPPPFPGRAIHLRKEMEIDPDWACKTLAIWPIPFTGSKEPEIECMIPETEHWIIQKTLQKSKILLVWDPENNRYRSAPLLEGFDEMEAVHGGEWLAVYYHDQGSCFLIDRNSLEIFEIPGRCIRSVLNTPAGNLVIVNLDPPYEKYDIIHFNTGSREYEKISFPERGFFRIIGIPDDVTAYALDIPDFDARNYLYRIDLSDGSLEAIFPKDRK